MRRFRNIFALSVVCISAILADATVGRWITTTPFDSLRRVSRDMLVAKTYGRYGLLESNGNWLLNPVADSITGFTNGYALAMSRNDEGLYRLMYIVGEDKSLRPINEDYIVGEYPFFSDGLLPVYLKGKAGYISPDGKVAVPFRFGNPQPFSEGLAAVSKPSKNGFISLLGMDKNTKMFYINTSGKEIKLSKAIGDVNLATTFKGGRALVRNVKGEYYTINTAGNMLSKEADASFTLDYRGALADGDESGADIDFGGFHDPVNPVKVGSLWGYKENDAVVIPAQFNFAGEFINNAAPVAKGQKWGLLGLASGDFNVKLEVSDSLPEDTTRINAIMHLEIPESLRHLNLTLNVSDGARTLSSSELESSPAGKFTIQFQFPKKDGNITIYDESLAVWDLSMYAGGFDTTPPVKEKVTFSFSSLSVKANSKDNATINLTLTNNTANPLKLPLKVKGAYAGKKSVNIPAGGSAKVPLSFAKILKKETRTVTVTAGEETATRKINLIPFFTE